MVPRKKSATVQLKVRMKEPLRAKIEKAAKSKGVSINAEIVDRLQQSILLKNAMSFFFGEAATLDEAAILRQYLTAVRLATSMTGERPDNWSEYAMHAPFAYDPGNNNMPFDFFAMAHAIRPKVDELLMKVEADVKENGPPSLTLEMYEVLPGKTSRAAREIDRRYNYEKGLNILKQQCALEHEDERKLRKRFPYLFVGVDAIRDGTLDIGD